MFWENDMLRLNQKAKQKGESDRAYPYSEKTIFEKVMIGAVVAIIFLGPMVMRFIMPFFK